MECKKPGSKIINICKELGDMYCVKAFDMENVIYRDLKNGYDFEISGLDNRSKTFSAVLYIWDAKKPHIVETVKDITSIDDLKRILSESEIKYLNL